MQISHHTLNLYINKQINYLNYLEKLKSSKCKSKLRSVRRCQFNAPVRTLWERVQNKATRATITSPRGGLLFSRCVVQLAHQLTLTHLHRRSAAVSDNRGVGHRNSAFSNLRSSPPLPCARVHAHTHTHSYVLLSAYCNFTCRVLDVRSQRRNINCTDISQSNLPSKMSDVPKLKLNSPRDVSMCP